MKSGIARIRELYPGADDFATYVNEHKANWPLIVRRNPMGVVACPRISWIGEDRERGVPTVGLRYAAFFEDLYGIRAGVWCLRSEKNLRDGLTKLLRDEFAAASLYKKVSNPSDMPTTVIRIITATTGRPDLYPKSLIRAAIALAAEREIDRNMLERVLARVA